MIEFDNVLFITFDYHENNKPVKSVAVATMESYLQFKIKDITIDTFSFNMTEDDTILFEQMMILKNKLSIQYDYICVSMYAWNMRYINNLINLIDSLNSRAVIVAGGYEVSNKRIDELINTYSRINHFIVGYAEESLYQIISKNKTSKVLSMEVDNNEIQAIYSNGKIKVDSNSSVRLETKRGCPYRCNYCAYKNNDHTKMTTHSINKIKEELLWLNKKKVYKVNILDAIFTTFNYREILDFLVKIQFKPIVSFQMKFEILYSILNKDEEILSMFSKLNVELEFGLQSNSTIALKNVERKNNMFKTAYVINQLNSKNINYTISVIRGLPGETTQTYEELLRYLKTCGCKNYIAYPLTLLNNTKLYDNTNLLKIKSILQNGMNYVIATYSYSYIDYLKMIEYETLYKA